MTDVKFETTGRTCTEDINSPKYEAAGLSEPGLGGLRRATQAVFNALDVDGNGLHDTRFKVEAKLGKDSASVTVAKKK